VDVDTILQIGRERWPRIEPPAQALERLAADAGAIDEVRAADLYLAAACAAGDNAAIEMFHSELSPLIKKLATRLATPGISADDGVQLVLARLLVGTEQAPPKIASYRGLGSLRNWVRSVTARVLINMHNSNAGARKEVAIEQALFEQLAAGVDPEMEFLKKRYRAAFRAAFEQAVGELTPRSRNQLRHVFIDRMSIDQLGQLYSVHRSTAARRLTTARDELLALTRKNLGSRLGVTTDEVDSIVGLIQSQWDVSISRIFNEID
jgi:RNA polymerase sigma-70 factor (ECF subfamily)